MEFSYIRMRNWVGEDLADFCLHVWVGRSVLLDDFSLWRQSLTHFSYTLLLKPSSIFIIAPYVFLLLFSFPMSFSSCLTLSYLIDEYIASVCRD